MRVLPLTMNQFLVIFYVLLISNRYAFSILDKYSLTATKPPLQQERLPWRSHFEYHSPAEYYNEDSFEEDDFVERKNSNFFSLCPPGETGQYPYGPDCRRFINCWKGRGALQVCAPGTLFNPDTKECDFPSKVQCRNENQRNLRVDSMSERYVRFPHHRPAIAQNPRTARNQNNDRPSISAKPYPGPPPYFGPSHLKPPTRPVNQPTDEVPSCDTGATGLFPHPIDCSKFLKCWNGKTFIQNCGPGTFFNPLISACDHPRNVACSHEDTTFLESQESKQYEEYPDINQSKHAERKNEEKESEILPEREEYAAVTSETKESSTARPVIEKDYGPGEIGKAQRHPKLVTSDYTKKATVSYGIFGPHSAQNDPYEHPNLQMKQSNSYPPLFMQQNQPAENPYLTQYPFYVSYPPRGPYSKSHQVQMPKEEKQLAFFGNRDGVQMNEFNRKDLVKPYGSQLPQHYESQHSHRLPPTWFQPPPFKKEQYNHNFLHHQQPFFYAPNHFFPQGEPMPSYLSQKATDEGNPCPSSPNKNKLNPFKSSTPNCLPETSYSLTPTNSGGQNSMAFSPGVFSPYYPSFYHSNKGFLNNNEFADRRPVMKTLNGPSAPPYILGSETPQAVQLNSALKPNVYSGYPQPINWNSLSAANPNREISINTHSSSHPSEIRYPFYITQSVGNQNLKTDKYLPQLHFQPVFDGNPTVDHGTQNNRPINRPDYSADENGNSNARELNESKDDPMLEISPSNANRAGNSYEKQQLPHKKKPYQSEIFFSSKNDTAHTKTEFSLPSSQTQLPPAQNNKINEENEQKNHILHKLDVRIREDPTYGDDQTEQSLQDVEEIEISESHPDKYFQIEEGNIEINGEPGVTFSPKKISEDEPVEKPSIKVRQTPPNGQTVRLRNGATHLDGYLEMKNNESRWGLVCDEAGAWSIDEATLACRELGFVRGAELFWQGYPVKSSEELVSVAVNTIACFGKGKSGSEISLSECKTTFTENVQCNIARNAVGLRCFDNLASHCQPNEILFDRHCYRLHGKENPDDPGIKTEEASENCKRFGGKLVDITSQYENDFISEWLIKKYPEVNSVMTGGIGISVLGRPMWIWEGTNDPMVFERWWSGWNGKQDIPRGSINGPLCIVLKKTYSCSDAIDEGQKEKIQASNDETCSADYFFWDVEDCNELRTSVYVCKRPMDDIGCVVGNGEGYAGTANTTASGQACLPWDHPKVIEGLARRKFLRERSARLSGHNYCRNLGDPDRHPWCFVENKGNSEYCAIPQCWDSVSGYHRSYDVHSSSCDENHFECKPGECVKKTWVCDGQKDCTNNRDEETCEVSEKEFKVYKNNRMKGTGKERWPNVNANTCSKLCLESKNFKCKSFSYNANERFCLLSDLNIGLSGRVVNEDGWIYYELVSESLVCTMEKGRYECDHGKCINVSNVCDGKKHCDDGSDERDCERLGYAVRLNGSEDRHKGRLEVRRKWGAVCDDMFDLREANVVCRELGFRLGAAEVLQHSYYPTDDPLFLMDDLECLGNETSLRECNFPGWGKHNCGSEEIAGVACRTIGDECADAQWKCKDGEECISIDYLCDGLPDCDDESDEDEGSCRSATQIRLVGGSDDASGRLEIRHFGIWGTICDDDFNIEAANVACRFLGYRGAAEVKKNAHFGPGKGPIWLDEVYCNGNERSLENCAHSQWGKNNCKHEEDVGIICNKGNQREKTKLVLSSSSAEVSDLSNEEKLKRALVSECSAKLNSKPTFRSHARVVGGSSVAQNVIPWQASIRVKSGKKSVHWCGAIVISPFHILTAGHCLRDYNKAAYFVRVGDYDTEVVDPQEEEFAIDHLYVHSNFSKELRLNNDLGLVKIKGEIKFSDDVRPACLATSVEMYRPGTNCTVSGWGSVSAHSAGFARTLRWAQVPILDPSICAAPFVYGDNLSEGMFCAGHLDGGVDSCQGDSGGPLTCRHGGEDYLFGITSWGHGCGRANKPGVYTNVAYYAKWIQEKIRSSLI